jgi:hypothetical protein
VATKSETSVTAWMMMMIIIIIIVVFSSSFNPFENM